MWFKLNRKSFRIRFKEKEEEEREREREREREKEREKEKEKEREREQLIRRTWTCGFPKSKLLKISNSNNIINR